MSQAEEEATSTKSKRKSVDSLNSTSAVDSLNSTSALFSCSYELFVSTSALQKIPTTQKHITKNESRSYEQSTLTHIRASSYSCIVVGAGSQCNVPIGSLEYEYMYMHLECRVYLIPNLLVKKKIALILDWEWNLYSLIP